MGGIQLALSGIGSGNFSTLGLVHMRLNQERTLT